MDDNKKKYVKPEVEVIDFVKDDIITFTNSDVFPENWTGEDWDE